MSALALRPDGTKSDAFLVHLGGTLGGEAGGFGRKVRGVKIFAEDSADYVEAVVRRYLRVVVTTTRSPPSCEVSPTTSSRGSERQDERPHATCRPLLLPVLR